MCDVAEVTEIREIVLYKMRIQRATLLERIAMYVFHGDHRHGVLSLEQLKQTGRIMGLKPHPEDSV